MSYLNHAQDPRRRATAIAGATIVHAALGLVLVIGLAARGVLEPEEGWNPFVLTPDRKPPPPPPERPEPQTRQASVVTAPTPPFKPLVTEDNEFIISDRVIDDNTLVVDTRPVIEPVVEPFRPAFTPRGARPSNGPLGWLSNADYPNGTEAEGVATYRLIVGTNGRVSACDVTRSTGNRQLDSTTCRLIKNRARFEAATDDTGAKVVGSYTGTVKWEIPE